jgi:hypothetical protein
VTWSRPVLPKPAPSATDGPGHEDRHVMSGRPGRGRAVAAESPPASQRPSLGSVSRSLDRCRGCGPAGPGQRKGLGRWSLAGAAAWSRCRFVVSAATATTTTTIAAAGRRAVLRCGLAVTHTQRDRGACRTANLYPGGVGHTSFTLADETASQTSTSKPMPWSSLVASLTLCPLTSGTVIRSPKM